MNGKFTGGHKGRLWFVNRPFHVQQLSYSPTDLGGMQLTDQQRLFVCNCFGVPISLLQSEGSNRATARESSFQHQSYAVQPRCCLIDSALTHQLVKPVDERLFLAFDNPVDRDEIQDAKVFDMAIRNNSKTVNEVRAEDNLPPVEWGDRPFGGGGGPAAPADPALAAKVAAEDKPGTGDDAPKEETETPTDTERSALYGRFHQVLDAIERRAAGDRDDQHD